MEPAELEQWQRTHSVILTIMEAALIVQRSAHEFLTWARDRSAPVADLSRDDAEALALQAAESDRRRFDAMEGSPGLPAWSLIGAFDFHRCWAFLFYAWPNMPPGIGVIVDKNSRVAFPCRYVDVSRVLEAATFDVTPSIGRTLRLRGSSPLAASSLRAPTELPGRDGATTRRLEDTEYTDADGTPIRVEVYFDEVTGLNMEIDRTRRRYRQTGMPEGPSEWIQYVDDTSDHSE
jgi:hypothetical protein